MGSKDNLTPPTKVTLNQQQSHQCLHGFRWTNRLEVSMVLVAVLNHIYSQKHVVLAFGDGLFGMDFLSVAFTTFIAMSACLRVC